MSKGPAKHSEGDRLTPNAAHGLEFIRFQLILSHFEPLAAETTSSTPISHPGATQTPSPAPHAPTAASYTLSPSPSTRCTPRRVSSGTARRRPTGIRVCAACVVPNPGFRRSLVQYIHRDPGVANVVTRMPAEARTTACRSGRKKKDRPLASFATSDDGPRLEARRDGRKRTGAPGPEAGHDGLAARRRQPNFRRSHRLRRLRARIRAKRAAVECASIRVAMFASS